VTLGVGCQFPPWVNFRYQMTLRHLGVGVEYPLELVAGSSYEPSDSTARSHWLRDGHGQWAGRGSPLLQEAEAGRGTTAKPRLLAAQQSGFQPSAQVQAVRLSHRCQLYLKLSSRPKEAVVARNDW